MILNASNIIKNFRIFDGLNILKLTYGEISDIIKQPIMLVVLRLTNQELFYLPASA